MGAIRPGSLRPIVAIKKRRLQSKTGRLLTIRNSPKWPEARQEIIDAYRALGRNWARLEPKQRASINAIAMALRRGGRVDAFKGEQPIAAVLEELAGEGKITLPPKKFKRPPEKPKRSQGT